MSENYKHPQQIRITTHGKIQAWVAFALRYFRENGEAICFHTLPVPHTAEGEAVRKGLPYVTANIPRLISVVEIVKREFLKENSGTKGKSRQSGLHQYNEICYLKADAGVEKGNDTTDILAVLSGKHVKESRTPYMKITLSITALPDITHMSTRLLNRRREGVMDYVKLARLPKSETALKITLLLIVINNELCTLFPLNTLYIIVRSFPLAVYFSDGSLKSLVDTSANTHPNRTTTHSTGLMPRRPIHIPISVTPSSPLPSSTPVESSTYSEKLRLLRKQWKWAAFSQFFFTFAHLFAMPDVTLNGVENDLVHGSMIFLPRVMQRLLVTLTQDRKISLENWQTALRKQYNKRDSLANPIGPEPPLTNLNELPKDQGNLEHDPKDGELDLAEKHSEGSRSEEDMLQDSRMNLPPGEPEVGLNDVQKDKPMLKSEESELGESRQWADLPMLTKLDSMHTLLEWQFQNPLRLRQTMRDDDETAQWRIQPIGYDAKANAYWLIGADRLWIQRVIPKPPKTLKRKLSKPNVLNQSSKCKIEKQRQAIFSPEGTLAPTGPSRRAYEASTSNGHQGRRRELRPRTKPSTSQLPDFRLDEERATRQNSRKSLGTRVSARLRGDAKAEEDGWQAVPKEWLAEGSPQSDPRHLGKAGIPKQTSEPDSDTSELTELSEEEGSAIEKEVRPELAFEDGALSSREPAPPAVKELSPPAPGVPDNFAEWETICVTLYEWENIASRFEKATHYREKALFKTLAQHIVPVIVEELKEDVRKRELKEAVVHRKRSSRIAIKESEKEEARAEGRRRVEVQEKMTRARRLELRQQKEEAEREKRDNVRRGTRSTRNNPIVELEEGSDTQVDVINGGPQQEDGEDSQMGESILNFHESGSRTPAGDDWELDCEVCHQRGINRDDGTPLVSCEHCGKWQHIQCLDRADKLTGRPKRNWDTEDFYCVNCRLATKQANRPEQIMPSPRHRHPCIADLSQPTLQYQNAAPYPQQAPDYAHPNQAEGHSSSHGYYEQNLGPQYNSQSYPRQVPPAAFAFTHYQPEHRGFSHVQVHQQPAFIQNPTLHNSKPNWSHGGAPNSPSYPHHNGIASLQRPMSGASYPDNMDNERVTGQFSTPQPRSQPHPRQHSPNQVPQFRYHQTMGSIPYQS